MIFFCGWSLIKMSWAEDGKDVDDQFFSSVIFLADFVSGSDFGLLFLFPLCYPPWLIPTLSMIFYICDSNTFIYSFIYLFFERGIAEGRGRGMKWAERIERDERAEKY